METLKKPRLTKKQRGFVKDYVKTGNGQQSAMRNYDVSSKESAEALASENLTKPAIIQAIQERLPDDLLAERHLELLNKRETETVYETSGTGEDKITTSITIDRGPDTQAVTKALDMAYKLKGTYAPEKVPSQTGGATYNFIFSKEVREDVDRIEAAIKERLTQKHVQEN